MNTEFSEESYEAMMDKLFLRFPSFQKNGAAAYKPGIANMEHMDRRLGCPHKKYDIVHVAGTNGKGSVSNMLASAIAACGKKVGLYTSPHILDFRERMRILETISGDQSEETVCRMVSKQYVWDFVRKWSSAFDLLDLSFFEITTSMALQCFADENVDVAVIETGLGGRFDSTNIVTPILSIITNIGLDHCDLLGNTLAEIAFEKAGIIKPSVPAVLGESAPEIVPVFEQAATMSSLIFADKMEPVMWDLREDILKEMDLQGAYQHSNLRTVLVSLDVLRGKNSSMLKNISLQRIREAIVDTAHRTGFRGRWERLSDLPLTICDIGHNEHGLRHNFAQLETMKKDGRCSDLIIVYGSVADKDVDSVLHILPEGAVYIFTQAQSKRALSAEKIKEKYLRFCSGTSRDNGNVYVRETVQEAVQLARQLSETLLNESPASKPLVYIGGSTYVVSEAVSLYESTL